MVGSDGIRLSRNSGYGVASVLLEYGLSSGYTSLALTNEHSFSRIDISQDTWNVAGSPGSIRFYTQPDGNAGTALERMRLTSTGNLGIGIPGPVAKLHVGDVGSAPNAMSITGNDSYIKGNLEVDGRIYGDGSGLTGLSGTISGLTDNYVVRANGSTAIENSILYDDGTNVGIGTIYPTSKLSIVGNASFDPSLNAGASANFNLARGTVAATDLAITMSGQPPFFSASIQHRHAVSNNAAYAIALNPLGGSIGIGTAEPIANLHVGGGSSAVPNAMPVTGSDLYVKGNIELDGQIYGDGSRLTNLPAGISGLTATRVPVASGPTTIIDSGIYYVDNNVGIGTAAPAAFLDVDQKLMVLSNGNVGIGVANPSQKLFVFGNMMANGTVYGWNGNSTLAVNTISAYYNGLTRFGNTHSSGYISLVTRNIDRVTVDLSGNVGIGTTIPRGLLEVDTGVYTTPFIVTSTGNLGLGTVFPQASLEVGTATAIPAGSFPAAAVKGNLVVDGRIYGDGTGLTGIAAVNPTVNNVPKSDGTAFIDSSIYEVGGSVGIGTAGPGSGTPYGVTKLHVYGTNAQGNSVVIENDGSTGLIGSELSLKTHRSLRGKGITLYDTESNNTWGVGVPYQYSNKFQIGYVSNYSTQGVWQQTATLMESTALLTILSTGNVGIGTYAPLAKLTVVGAGTGTGRALEVDDNLYNPKFVVLDNGNVGMGTTAPVAKLEIAGSGGVGTSLLVNQWYSSYWSAQFIHTDGPYVNLAGAAYSGVFMGGNVGIGLTAPLVKLHIGDPGSLPDTMSITGDDAYIKGNLEVDGRIYGDGSGLTGVSGAISGLTANRIPVASGSTTLVDSAIYQVGGNIGVGSASPSSLLDVGGTTQLRGAPGGIGLYVSPLGNVGIGTTVVGAYNKLEIQDSDASGNGVRLAVRNTSTGTSAFAIYTMYVGSGLEGGAFFGSRAENIRFGIVNGITFRAGLSSQDIGLSVGGNAVGSGNGANFILKSSGNVGIGTILPLARLHVATDTTAPNAMSITGSDLYVRGNVEVDGRIYGDGSGLTGVSGAISGLTANLIPVASGSSTLVDSVIYQVGGNVGIGTSIPLGAIDISATPGGALGNATAIFRNNNGTSSASAVRAWTVDAGSAAGVYGDLAGFDGTFWYGIRGNSNTIFSPAVIGVNTAGGIAGYFSGSIGIGTTSPQAMLQVAGSVNIESGYSSGNFGFASNRGVYSGSSYGSFFPVTTTSGAVINSSTSVKLAIDTDNNDATAVFQVGKDNYLVNSNTFTPLFTINQDANVGIGTTEPAARLYVSDAGSAPDAMTITGNDAYIKGNLEIDGRIYGDGSGLTGISGSISGLTPNLIPVASSSSTLVDSVIYQAGGNLGIGTASPAQKIDIYNTTGSRIRLQRESLSLGVTGQLEFTISGTYSDHTSGIRGNYEAGDARRRSLDLITSYQYGQNQVSVKITPEGAVGIGSTSPMHMLDVAGNVGISTTGVIYKGADRFIHNFQHPTGQTVAPDGQNTFVGIGAGNFTMGETATSAGEASSNTAVGWGALQANTVGYMNTAVGHTALLNNTSADYNTALGAGALYTVTIGGWNVAVGDRALYYTNNGTRNTAVGDRALMFNVAGSRNVAMGLNAGGGGLNTTTNSDIQNTVAIGYHAGDQLGTGDNNILLGYQAGDALTTGDNNIVIGYDIDTPSVTSANTLNIGNLMFGMGIDGTGTTISTGNVAIGTNTPLAKLHISTGTDAPNAMPITGSDLYVKGNIEVDGRIYGDGSGLTGLSGGITGLTPTRVPVASNATTIVDSIIYSVSNNVGIGSAAPGSSLDVAGTAHLRGASGVTGLYVTSSGSVGIGNTDPMFKLVSSGHIYAQSSYVMADDGFSAYVQTNGVLSFSSGGPTLSRNSNDALPGLIISNIHASATGDLLQLKNATSTPFVVLNNGNVGIGTTAPVARLHVGDAGTTPAMPITGNDAYVKGNLEVDGRIYGDGAGLTGITATASLPINVQNDVEIMEYDAAATTFMRQIYADRSIALGEGAGAALSDANNALDNIAIGYHAGAAISTSDDNVMVGSNAGAATSTSSGNNTFVGSSAGAAHTVGNDNTFIGSGAGDAIVDGVDNTLIGRSAGGALITQNNNVYVGMNAGSGAASSNSVLVGWSSGASLTGAAAVMIGYRAGDSSTDSGLFIGGESGRYNTTGSNNTFVGYQTGLSNDTNYLTGDNNSLFGYQAGNDLESGANNTFIGYQTGDLVTSGASNTILGSGAGGTNLDTEGRNILIGAGVDSNNTDDYLNIGNTIFGDMGTNPTTPNSNDAAISIAGNLGLGTSTPLAKLYIADAGSAPDAMTITGNDAYIKGNLEVDGRIYGDASNLTGIIANDIALPIDVEGETDILDLNTTGDSFMRHIQAERSIAWGQSAGSNFADGGDVAADHIAIGHQAAQSVTTGDWLIAIGNDAARDVTTGNSSVYVGHWSGRQNVSGQYNAFLGNGTAYDAASMSQSVLVGMWAGASATGSNNVFIGFRSGEVSSSAANNIYLGSSAGRYATASNNTLIGYQSGMAASGAGQLTGTDNTFLGFETGMVTTSGYGNTFIGDSAGIVNATGGDNTLLGKGTGASLNVESRNILIGAGVDTDNTNDYLNIGNTIFGDMGTNPTTPLSNDAVISIAGNLGIGTSVPVHMLDVAGNVGISTTGVIYKGTDQFIHNFQHPTGGTTRPDGGNTFVGLGSGNFTMGSTGDDAWDASYNTAVGWYTLRSVTTGGSNTATGYGALRYNTTGYSNTAVGSAVLYENDTGAWNTAIGGQALYFNNSGGNNTASGVQALFRNDTGGSNTANGVMALTFNVGGNNNTAVGTLAGGGGYGSTVNSDLNNTVAVGYYAGYALGTGDNNTLLGYRAGDNLTTGDNNIVLGYDLEAPSATSANTLNIGNLIFGTGMNGTGTTISTGNVAIGTNAPLAKLHIATGTDAPNAMPITGSDLYVKGNIELDGKIYGDGSGLTGLSGSISGLTATRVPVASGPTTIVDSSIYNVGGNVGIGAAAPSAPLMISSDTGSGDEGNLLRLDSFNGTSGNGASILFTNNNDGVSLAKMASRDAGNYGGELIFSTKEADVVSSTLPIERMRIISSGNIGIGTTTPTANLSIHSTSAQDAFRVRTNNGTVWQITEWGDLYNSFGTGIRFDDGVLASSFTASGNTYITSGRDNPSSPYNIILKPSSTGNVGIGTILPLAKLHVAADTTAPNAMSITGSDAYIRGNLEVDGRIYGDGSGLTGLSSSQWTTTGLDIYYATGNVAITTTAPIAKLDIQTNGIATTPSDAYGIVLKNSTPSTVGAPEQYSPGIVFSGGAWSSTGAVNVPTKWRVFSSNDTIGGQAQVNSSLLFQSSENGAAYTTIMSINDVTNGYTSWNFNGGIDTTYFDLWDSGATFYMGQTNSDGYTLTLTNTSAFNYTTGTGGVLYSGSSFAPPSGTGVYNFFTHNGTINQAGGANGITRGIYLNPTLTSAYDWRSLEMTNNSGFAVYQSGANARNYFNGNIGIGTTAAVSKLHLVTPNIGTSPSQASGLFLENPTLATSGNPQYSPSITLAGSSYASGAAVLNKWEIYNATTNNIGSGAHTLVFQSTQGATVITPMELTENGSLSITNHLSAYSAGVYGGGFTQSSASTANYFVSNVGVGTTTPVAKLHVGGEGVAPNAMPITGGDLYVRGNIEVDGRIYGDGSGLTNLSSSQWSTTGSDLYYNTGNVGLGTTSPVRKLEVKDGSIYINQTSAQLIMKKPDGTCASCGPDNSDIWVCTGVTCP
jgi:hypothetical protein